MYIVARKITHQMLQLVQRPGAHDIRSDLIGAQVLLLQVPQHRVRLLLHVLDVIVRDLDVAHLLRTEVADQLAPIAAHERNGVVLVEQSHDVQGGRVVHGLLVGQQLGGVPVARRRNVTAGAPIGLGADDLVG